MMKIALSSLALAFCVIGFSQSNEAVVFKGGDEGYKNYRIPAMISLPDGDILAFCEGRVDGLLDFGNTDIVMKRSSDHGKTWSPLQVVADNENLKAGSPAPVVDLTDPYFPNGIIFLFYNTNNKSEEEIRNGNGLAQAWYKISLDNGNTWSPEINITLQVHRPKQPKIDPGLNFREDWRVYANTPGHAMQFEHGKYKGRIFVVARHSAGEPKDDYEDYLAHGYYTDDHGKTFHLSENIKFPGAGEAMATEISEDRLMVNICNLGGRVRQRIVVFSKTGGQSWDASSFDKNLPDPICQASILTINVKKDKSEIAFCNPADTKRRDNLMLRVSEDEGKTWNKNYVIYNTNAEANIDPAAYSDLANIHKKNAIGILYEKDNYSKIVFTTHTLK
jgi:sialidase-1